MRAPVLRPVRTGTKATLPSRTIATCWRPSRTTIAFTGTRRRRAFAPAGVMSATPLSPAGIWRSGLGKVSSTRMVPEAASIRPAARATLAGNFLPGSSVNSTTATWPGRSASAVAGATSSRPRSSLTRARWKSQRPLVVESPGMKSPRSNWRLTTRASKGARICWKATSSVRRFASACAASKSAAAVLALASPISASALERTAFSPRARVRRTLASASSARAVAWATAAAARSAARWISGAAMTASTSPAWTISPRSTRRSASRPVARE